MPSSQSKNKSWMFESNNIVINTIAIGTVSRKRLQPKAVESLNRLLLDAFKQLDETGLKRFNWLDLKGALVFQLISPDYTNGSNRFEKKGDKNNGVDDDK